MTDPLSAFKEHVRELHETRALTRLLEWDQLTVMPPAGAGHRADHLALLSRHEHQLLIDPRLGRLLDELGPLERDLAPESDDAGLLRFVRREHGKAVRVPTALRVEMARASADARSVWREAKAASSFQLFLPHLERNFELRAKYIDCFETPDDPYDVVLDDYEPELKTATVERIFGELKAELVPLVAALGEREGDAGPVTGPFPVDRQLALSQEVVEAFGHRPGTWRIDPTEHPFATGAGVDDIRITTHFDEGTLTSFFATMHEYGHGLYEHQIPTRFAHLPIGAGWSAGLHESQSRLWENLVGRGMPFWRFFYPRLQAAFPEQFRTVELDQFYAAINTVRPSLIRIYADEVTYPLHVMLRFELEHGLINGSVSVRDLPQLWAEKMDAYLGIEVPDDKHGVLQDIHWAWGLIGYFPTYLLGSVMSVQIWEKASSDIGDLDAQIAAGEFGSLREWLAEHVHAAGRKFAPQETLRRATGSTIETKPFVDYLIGKYRSPVLS